MPPESPRRLPRIPHVFVLLAGMILATALATYVVPSGSYERREIVVGESTRNAVVPGTYESVPKHLSPTSILLGGAVEGESTPVSVVELLSAIPRGLIESADIVFMIFLIGGVFGVLQETGTISAVLHALLEKFRHSWVLLTIVLMTAVAIGGSTLGMGEEFIPLIPIFLVVAREIRCDRIFAVAVVFVGAEVGFAAATTNPFTVNIAQSIAEVPLNSALGFRSVFLVAALAVAIVHVLRYGARIRRDPTASFLHGEETVEHREMVAPPVERRHVAIIVVCVAVFAFILYAVQGLGWWIPEMTGGFLLMGGIAVLLGKLDLDRAAKAFVRGMEEMVVAAIVVGFARGVTVAMEDGQILDTLIYSAASALEGVPSLLAAFGMLAFQTTLNFFIPSGSGQATVTMPLMAPLADILGLSRQVAVFAFTCGDGLSNMVIPTSGILMAMIGLAKVPYEKWIRFAFPLFLQLFALAALFLGIGVVIGL